MSPVSSAPSTPGITCNATSSASARRRSTCPSWPVHPRLRLGARCRDRTTWPQPRLASITHKVSSSRSPHGAAEGGRPRHPDKSICVVCRSLGDTGRLGRRRSRRVSDRGSLGFATRLPPSSVAVGLEPSRHAITGFVRPAAREPPEYDSQVSKGAAGLGGLDVRCPPEPVTPGLDQPIPHPAPYPCRIPRRHLSGSGCSRLSASAASSMPASASVVYQRRASTRSGRSSLVSSRSPRLYWARG